MDVYIRRSKKFFITQLNANVDLKRDSKIILGSIVTFGWCNMKQTHLETSLIMGHGSSLRFGGEHILIGYGSYIQVGKNARLVLDDCFINREVKIICNWEIYIGKGTIIVMGIVFRDNDAGNHSIFDSNYKNQKSVHIGNHVWIGENCFIMKGVTIGEGAVIGACSVVTHDIPPKTLAVGKPAKVIRENIEWEAKI